jgi:hypothetical protein
VILEPILIIDISNDSIILNNQQWYICNDSKIITNCSFKPLQMVFSIVARIHDTFSPIQRRFVLFSRVSGIDCPP